jgi:anti-sigma B factor antagonist
MHFETKKKGIATILKVQERKLDATTSPELKGKFLILCKPQLKELIIDLSEVEFCDSTGLSALLIAERQMRENNGRVKLVGVHKKVLSLLKISHLDRTFQIFETLAKAAKG